MQYCRHAAADRQTHRHTQTCVTTMHFASSTTHAKCKKLQSKNRLVREMLRGACASAFASDKLRFGATTTRHRNIGVKRRGCGRCVASVAGAVEMATSCRRRRRRDGLMTCCHRRPGPSPLRQWRQPASNTGGHSLKTVAVNTFFMFFLFFNKMSFTFFYFLCFLFLKSFL